MRSSQINNQLMYGNSIKYKWVKRNPKPRIRNQGMKTQDLIIKDREELDQELNKLQKVFANIQPYQKDNIGLRSLKNLLIWLIVYALTEKKEQNKVLKTLLEKAGKLNEFVTIKKTIIKLCRPENLAFIRDDYEAANGKFKICIRDKSRIPAFKKKAADVGLESLVEKHLEDKTEGQQADFIFKMDNTIEFYWQCLNGSPIEFGRGKKISFDEDKQEIPYLTAKNNDTDPKKKNANIAYNIVELENRHYHVVRFGVVQNDEKNTPKDEKDSKIQIDRESTYIYLIEPFNSEHLAGIQSKYLDIIKLFNIQGNYKERYKVIKTITEKSLQKNVKIDEVIIKVPEKEGCIEEKNISFNLIVNFPELAGHLKTTERRLGIYECYLGKTIGSFIAERLDSEAKREIIYDFRGGKIENHEQLICNLSSYYVPPASVIVTIEYTTQGPFFMVYSSNDCYPFQIVQPTKNLEHEFTASGSHEIIPNPTPKKPSEEKRKVDYDGHFDQLVAFSGLKDPKTLSSEEEEAAAQFIGSQLIEPQREVHNLSRKVTNLLGKCSDLSDEKPDECPSAAPLELDNFPPQLEKEKGSKTISFPRKGSVHNSNLFSSKIEGPQVREETFPSRIIRKQS